MPKKNIYKSPSHTLLFSPDNHSHSLISPNIIHHEDLIESEHKTKDFFDWNNRKLTNLSCLNEETDQSHNYSGIEEFNH